MISPINFTVRIDDKLIDQLDDCLSPGDGVQAIDDLFQELPKVHQSRETARPQRKPRKWLRVYRGRYGWFDVGFSYVQVGNELHVVEFWPDADWAKPNRAEVDSVIGERTEGRGR
jgi:hypothetical protein